MAVARLGTPVSNQGSATLSFTVPAGTDRLLVVCLTDEDNANAATHDSVDYGGQAMVEAVQFRTANTGFSAAASIWYLLEAGIAAASGTTITPSYSEALNEPHIHAMAFEGVDQTGGSTTNPATASARTNASTPNPLILDLTEADEGCVVAAAACGNATGALWTSGDTIETTEEVDGSSVGTTSDRLSTTAANINIEPAFTSQNRAAGVSATFAPAGATLNEETVSSSATGVAALARRLSLFRDIEATDTGSATLSFSRALSNLTLAATSIGTATLNRLLLLKRTFSATVTGVASVLVSRFQNIVLNALSLASTVLPNVYTHFPEIEATGTGVTALLRRVFSFRALAATAVGSATLNRLLFLKRVFSATATGVATLVDTLIGGAQLFSETISAVVTGNATLNRTLNLFRTFAATVTGVATLVFRNLFSSIVFSASSIGTATLQRLLSLFRTFSAAVTGLATFIIEDLGGGVTQVALAATASGVAALNRFVSFFRTFPATVTGSVTLNRFLSLFRIFPATITGLATLATEAITLGAVVFNATMTGVARMNIFISQLFSVATTGSAVMEHVRVIFLSAKVSIIGALRDIYTHFPEIETTATGLATLIQEAVTGIALRTLSAVATGVATMNRRLLAFRVFSAAMTGVATFIATTVAVLVEQVLAATATGSATLLHFVTWLRALSATITGVAEIALLKTLTRALEATMTGLATISRTVFFRRILSAASVGDATLNRLVFYFRTLAATAVNTATLVLFSGVEFIFSATMTGVATLVTLYQQFITAFTGHGGMGRGDGKTRWASRRRSWTRRK